MTKRMPDLCVYCNTASGITHDHVIAKVFFTKPMPPMMATVPACPACQDAKAQDDMDFRDLLVLDPQALCHPVAAALRNGAFVRSAGYGSSRVMKDIETHSRPDPDPPPGSLAYGDPRILSVMGDLPIRTLSRITRGLFYYTTKGKRLPTDLNFSIGRLEDERVDDIWQWMLARDANGPAGYATLFETVFRLMPPDGHRGVWVMRWYGGIGFAVDVYLCGEQPTEMIRCFHILRFAFPRNGTGYRARVVA